MQNTFHRFPLLKQTTPADDIQHVLIVEWTRMNMLYLLRVARELATELARSPAVSLRMRVSRHDHQVFAGSAHPHLLKLFTLDQYKSIMTLCDVYLLCRLYAQLLVYTSHIVEREDEAPEGAWRRSRPLPRDWTAAADVSDRAVFWIGGADSLRQGLRSSYAQGGCRLVGW